MQIKLNIQGHKQKQGTKDFFKVDKVEFDLIPQKTSFKFINPARAQQGKVVFLCFCGPVLCWNV